MEENINSLITEFKKIKSKGKIKSVNKGKGSVGLTLEKSLGKKFDKTDNPDYKGIELKTKKSHIYECYTLFSMVPDSYENVITDIRLKYGHPTEKTDKYKVFYRKVYANRYECYCDKKYIYTLEVDREKEKVYFIVLDRQFNLIDKSVSWSFEKMKTKINKKLIYLAIVSSERIYEYGSEFFIYNKMKIYKLRSFEKFIDLLEKGKIMIFFKIGVYKDGDFAGNTYDHGTAFCIPEKNINELFEEIRSV